MKKLLAALGTLALVLGIVALVASPASAHVGTATANCASGVVVTLTNYDTSHGNANSLTVTIDGKSVDSESFSGGLSKSFKFATGPKHTWDVSVTAWDDPQGSNGWTFESSGKVTNCESDVTPAEVKGFPAVCTGLGTVGDGSYTVPTNSTGVKEYQILVNGTWTAIAAKSYPAAPGTVVHIRAVHLDGYKFTGKSEWDITIGSVDKSTCVAPPNPTPYVLAAWLMPSWSGDYHTPTWKPYQSFFAKTDLASKNPTNLNALDSQLMKCGTSYQVDLYNDSATTTALIVGGKLYGSNNPAEDFPSPSGWGVTYKLVHNADCKDAAASVGVSPPSCQANGVATFTLTFATWSDTTGPEDQAVGDHTRTAKAQVGHLFSNGLSSMDVSYTIPTKLTGQDCLVPFQAGDPKFVDPSCDVATPGTIVVGTYTVITAEHVRYDATLNGSAPQTLTVGVHYPAHPGDVVVITPIVEDGYVITPAIASEDLMHTFAAVDHDCLNKADFVQPAATSQSCLVTGDGDGLTTDAADTTTSALSIRSLSSSAVNATLTAAVTPSVKSVVTHTLVDAFITIPSIVDSPHVTYYIDDVQATPGKHILKPGSYKVSAMAKDGYFLQGYNGPWTEVLTSAVPCGDLITHPLVDPSAVQVQMGCLTDGSYTLSNDLSDAAALVWTVNGSNVSQGLYKVSAPSTVVVHVAVSGPSYGLENGARTDWTFHFVRPTSCDLTTLALTGSTPTGWIALGYAMLVSGLALLALRFARRRGEQA